MKHLVIAVSYDSSLDLLESFADIIVLDKEAVPNNIPFYETLYIRSHFGQATTLPQVFHSEIEDIVRRARNANPGIKFIDNTSTVEQILTIEDKWHQYEIFNEFMPKTQLLTDELGINGFERPVFKNRLSSHGNGVTWNREEVTNPINDWLVQESLDITEELRIYIIRGEVYKTAAIRQSKTSNQSTQAVDTRELIQEEIDFSLKVAQKAHNMDIIGLDIARTSDGKLYLMEANRSPGFGVFNKLTSVNLAAILYEGKDL